MNVSCLWDLHLHTAASDHGHRANTIQAYLDTIDDWTRIGALAFVDTFTADGLLNLQAAKIMLEDKALADRLIGGVELTVSVESSGPHRARYNVDLLCYNWPSSWGLTHQDVFNTYSQWRQQSGRGWIDGCIKYASGHRAIFSQDDMLAVLRSYRDESYIELQGITPARRESLTRRLIERRVIQTPAEYAVLERFLTREEFVRQAPDAAMVCPALKQLGVITILAHPQRYEENAHHLPYILRRFHEQLQFDGVECGHREISPTERTVCADWCSSQGLLKTAGSDSSSLEDLSCHVGRHCGADEWLQPFLERLTNK